VNKILLPTLAALMLLPQPADAWNSRRRNPWADFGTSIGYPMLFTIVLCSGLHYTWPLKYRGSRRLR